MKTAWRERLWLFVALGIYALVMFALACRKFYVMNSNTGDIAVVVNALWNTLHGRFFYCVYHDMSHFGVHVTPAIFLALPLFALVQSAYSVFLAQSVVLAAAGIPFYHIARRTLGDTLSATLMTAGFLLYPTVIVNHVNQVHWEYWSLPFLLAAVYYLLEERFGLFLCFAFLGMTGQENLPLTVGIFGVYAAILRRPIKWIVSPIVLAWAYGIVAFKVVIPYFMQGKTYAVAHYFQHLGHTPVEALLNVLRNPWLAIGPIFQPDRLLYLVSMVQPLLWVVPFWTWAAVLFAPSLGVNLIIPEGSFRVLAWHYNPTSGAMLCVAAVFGVVNAAKWLEKRFRFIQAQQALSFAIAALSLASWPFWFNPNEYRAHSYFETLRKAVLLVEPGKSVLAPVSVLGHLADRAVPLHQWQFNPANRFGNVWSRDRMYTLDYIILDGNEQRFPDEIVTRELVMSFYTNTNYRLVLNENNVFVFVRQPPTDAAAAGQIQ